MTELEIDKDKVFVYPLVGISSICVIHFQVHYMSLSLCK